MCICGYDIAVEAEAAAAAAAETAIDEIGVTDLGEQAPKEAKKYFTLELYNFL